MPRDGASWRAAARAALLLAPLALLALADAARAQAVGPIKHNADFGIRSYEFYSIWQDKPTFTRVWLRMRCGDSGIVLRGMVESNLVAPGPVDFMNGAHHYMAAKHTTASPPRMWLLDSATNETYDLTQTVAHFIENGPDNARATAWNLDGRAKRPARSDSESTGLQLMLEGAAHHHQLLMGGCTHSRGGAFGKGQAWVAVGTRQTPLGVPPRHLAEMLLAHAEHHVSVGFAGVLVLVDHFQAKALARQAALRDVLAAGHLLLWAWEHELPNNKMTAYHQIPKNNLARLAVWGAGARLAFLDFDEYLIVAAGQRTVKGAPACAELDVSSHPCSQLLLVQAMAAAPDKSRPEYLAWSDNGHWTRRNGSELTVLPCLEHGVAWTRKAFVDADGIEYMLVHGAKFGTPPRACRLVPASCAYVLHFMNLMRWRDPGDGGPSNAPRLKASWVTGALGAPGHALFRNKEGAPPDPYPVLQDRRVMDCRTGIDRRYLETSTDEESGFSDDGAGGVGLAERLVAAGVRPAEPSQLFDDRFVTEWSPLVAAYFPAGCVLGALRMALWIGGIALDLPAWRNPSVIAGFLALLGVTVEWKGAEHVPKEGRFVLVSNHVSVGDLLMLFGQPRRYVHLITPLLPAAVYGTRNLPAMLQPANKDTYEALASASNSGGAGANGNGGSSNGGSGGGGKLARGLSEDALAAPVHLFPEGGMTNGGGMMAFSRGFTKFAADMPVVPAAVRLVVPFPQVKSHTLTSNFLANLFFFGWQPWARLEVTALPAMALRPGEGRGAFVQRVQEDIARELGSYVVPGFSVSHKRALATGGTGESGGGARRRRARGGGA